MPTAFADTSGPRAFPVLMTDHDFRPIAFVSGSPTLDGQAIDSAGLARRLQDESISRVLERLRGAYSCAVLLANDDWVLAVDRFSIAPLCWRVVAGTLRFHARADVLGEMGPKADIDPQAIYDYLYFHAIPSPRTMFLGVQRLPAGHYLHWKSGQASVQPYWVPRFNEPLDADFGAQAGEFRRLLNQAVARRVDVAKPACYLSGGTDSSTVAGMVREVCGEGAHSYSIGFEAEGYDEMAYARIAAQRFGCHHHEYYVTPQDLLQSIPLVAQHFDQPFGNSSAVPAYHCALRAREDGVNRILAGDGGDELFGGNARYAKQRQFEWYGKLPDTLRRGVLEPLLMNSPLGQLPGAKKAASYVEQARVPMPGRLDMYNLLTRTGAATVLPAAVLQQMNPALVSRQQQQVWDLPQCKSTLNRTLAFDWRYTLAESDLPKVTGSAALAGLDVAFPLLDEDLLAFSMQLPTSYKLRGLKLRWFFKEALRGFLPDEIINKPKHGFGLPFGVWATQHEGLGHLARDSLGSLEERGLVLPAFRRQLLDTLLPRHPGYYGEMVWILMMLEQWLRHARPDYRAPR